MRIAFCHNYYQQPGGEDQVFQGESALMEKHGHEVMRYTKHNDEVNQLSRLKLMKKTFWNSEVLHELRNQFEEFKPDVVHFTNTFPLISPAAYKAAKDAGAAVVQSLHNFRFICPGSLLLRNGKNCESCVGKLFAWPAIWHKCYRDSFLATAVTAGSNSWHRMRGTLRKNVNRFIALTQFSRQKFVEGGLDSTRIRVKPNFVTVDRNLYPRQKNGRALFVGRLSKEKGIDTLLECWKIMNSETGNEMGLDIVGDGPLMAQVSEAANSLPNANILGRLESHQVRNMMAESSVVIVPSMAYETFGMVVIEAFSVGTPVIVSDHGSLAELVNNESNGFKFEPGNPADLAHQTQKIAHDRELAVQMGLNAREEFERKYTSEANYQMLQDIYSEAIQETRV